MNRINERIAAELDQPISAIENVVRLLDEGNTIPFIARYRKEAHGAMNDELLRQLEERLKYLRSLEERKSEITRLIASQGKLTEELELRIDNASTLSALEDIYRPYKPKRRTRATIAREKGLETLAAFLFSQGKNLPSPEKLALKYISPANGVNTIEEALSGASDIIAEDISDSAEVRNALRHAIMTKGQIMSVSLKADDSVYKNYYNFTQYISKIQGHQILAINRGEKENFIKVSIFFPENEALSIINSIILKQKCPSTEIIKTAASDAYSRLLFPSLQNEVRGLLTENANEGAIHNFSSNLKALLMQPPVKGHITMGLDPGYRMGCKVAVVDKTGKVLDTGVVYPTMSAHQKDEAIKKLSALIKKYRVEHIAIGNGTASRETEQMTVELIKNCPGVSYMVVSEAGASVYSASKLASEEFPQFDVNLRSAVSIARRLQDPLAELVKIEPKAIGVGQYQHDMPSARLDDSLGAVVEDCVNAVGVDINTASPSLLKYISGLTNTTAKNIVLYREENGPFTSRKQILKVPKLGPKAFEQCAGFLRIPESNYFLDNTGVHPESYAAAETLFRLCGIEPSAFNIEWLTDVKSFIEKNGREKIAEKCGIGALTLDDIIKEISKPGRDPRDSLPQPIFKTDILDIKNLKPGMILKGTVRNVIDFGAFVDIGVHQDGLVHISEISSRRIKHPSDVLTIGDVVTVLILSVDEDKKRISLSIKQVNKESCKI